MSIDSNKCCGGHTKEKEQSGECCQIEAQQKAEQDTYEYNTKIGPEPKSVSKLLQEGMELQRRLEDE
jgi:hypothetical protein